MQKTRCFFSLSTWAPQSESLWGRKVWSDTVFFPEIFSKNKPQMWIFEERCDKMNTVPSCYRITQLPYLMPKTRSTALCAMLTRAPIRKIQLHSWKPSVCADGARPCCRENNRFHKRPGQVSAALPQNCPLTEAFFLSLAQQHSSR